MILREKLLFTMPQAFLWASGIADQTCGEPHRREKALHHRKHHPWDWNLDMGTLFKGRIYGAVVMRKCYVALKEFCLENQLRQVHIQQLYLPFQLCNNTNLINEPFHAGFLVLTSSGACPCTHIPMDPTCQHLGTSSSLWRPCRGKCPISKAGTGFNPCFHGP